MEVDDDPAQCDAEPTPVLCAANKACKFHIVSTFLGNLVLLKNALLTLEKT